jgi:hypothetical protein
MFLQVPPGSPEYAKTMATIAQARAQGLRVEEDVFSANGSYAAKLIEIALDSKNPIRAARHEAIHALKELGFFTPQQWAVLERKAKSEWLKKYNIEGSGYGSLSKEGQIEEAIADAFSDFDQETPPTGQIGILFNKVKTFFEALGNAFRGSGFQTSSDVFTLVEEGRLTGPGTAVAGETRYSLDNLQQYVTPEAAEGVLRRRAARAEGFGAPINERVIIGTDDNAFAVGKITPSDWRMRVEGTMTKDEVIDARNWYQQLRNVFEPLFGPKASEYSLAWLLSQQRASPTKGFTDVLRASDIAQNKLRIKKAGLNEKALVSALRGEIPEGGIGSKLLDFIDSELGRTTRTVVRGAPEGRQPAAIDVWAQRDIGFVDDVIKKFVARKYGNEAANKLEIDTARFGEPQYEYGVDFYNNVAEYLNQQNYLDGGWTASEVQAVGWVNMQMFVGVKPEFVRDIINGNTRRISLGLTPGAGTPMVRRLMGKEIPVSEAIKVIEELARASNVKITQTVDGVGAYLTYIEGSIQIDTIGSPESVQDFMDMIGYAFQQTEMISTRPLASGKNSAIDIVSPSLNTQDKAIKFFTEYLNAMPKDSSGDPIAPGFQQIKVDGVPGIRLLNFGGKWNKKQLEALENAAVVAEKATGIKDAEFVSMNVQFTSAKNNWVKYPNGDQYVNSLRNRGRLQETELLQREFPPARFDLAGDGSINWRPRIGYEPKLSLRLDELVGGPSIGSGISIRPQQPTAQSFDAVHYGKQRVETLFGSMYGTGIKGAEAQRVFNSDDPRVRQRAYFYIPFNNGRMPKPEAGLGQEVHVQRLNNLLGPGPEMQGLASASRTPDGQFDENAFESSVIDAGYDGYAVPNMGMAVVLGSDVPVVSRGTRQEVEAKPDKDKIQIGDRKYSLRSTETPEFKNWFKKSPIVNAVGKPKMMFHGTSLDIEEFIPGKTGAIYVSPDPEFAGTFSKYSQEREIVKLGKNLDQDLEAKQRILDPIIDEAMATGDLTNRDLPYHRDLAQAGFIKNLDQYSKEYWMNWFLESPMRDAAHSTGVGPALREALANMLTTGRNVMPLYVNPQNPFDYENNTHVNKVAKLVFKYDPDTYERANPKAQKYHRGTLIDGLKEGDWRVLEEPVVQEAIKELGFDAFYVKEQDVKNLGLYNPKQFKSATGNIGTYGQRDPTIEEAKQFGLTIEEAKAAQKRGDIRYSLRQTNTKEFKDWFGESKIVNGDSTPKVMYHGLAKDTTDFTRKTERGAPIFLTDDPTFAPRFAADSYASVARNPEPYLTKEQIDGGVKRAIAAIKKDYGKDSLGKEMIESLKTGNLKDATPEAREYIQKEFINLLPTGPHIMPLYVRAERSFDYDNPEHIERVINNLKDSNINTELLSYDLNKGDWETIESPRVQEAIKELGFDSFYVEEIGRKNLAVYEPNQVKSAIGNLGTFSRTNNDIRYSLALEGLKPSSALIPDEGGNPSGNLGFMPEKLGGKPIRLLVGTHNDLVDELVNEKMYRPVSYGGNHILNRIMSYPRREPIGAEELLEKIARAAQKTSQTYTRIYKDGKRFILFDGKNSLILGENPDSMSIITMYTQTDPNRRYGNPAWFGRAPVVPEFVGAIRGTKVEAKEGRIAPSEVDTKAKRVYTPSEVGAIAAGESTKEPTKGTLSLNKKMSLRVPDKTVTKFFDDQEQIPMSEGVEIIRDNWIGGVSGIGDRDGVYYLDQVYGGPEYTQQVQDLVRRDLGESFKGYRLMSQEEFEELQTGAIGTQLASVSLVPETALAIASIPQYSRRPKGDLIVVELDLTPDHVQMVGHVPEKELIIDYGIGYDPTAIEPIISPVRFSLKDFDRNDLPKGDARKRSVYTLPAGTKLYHGSNKDTAAEIKKAGHVLLAEPPYKSSGGDTSEGYLIWFGDKEIADRYAEGQAEGRAARDKKEPGEVFATVTNEPMRLVEQERYELNAEQAKKINDFYKMPDYKLFKAGENLGNVSTRLLNHSDARAKAKSYTNINGDPQYSILKDIASLLGFDGYYYDLGVALPAERGISLGLTEAGEFVGKPMTRFSLRQQIIDGADAIARMPKDVKENTEYGDMPGGYQSHNFYEARKLAPKPTNKLKKVTENNSETLNMETDYVLNVDGEHYYIVLEEDPDDEDAFVYSFSPATDPNKFTTTVTFDVDELIKEIRDSAPTAPRTQYSLAGAANLQSFGLAPTDAKDNAIFLLQDKNIDLKRIIEGIRKNGKILSEDYDAYRKEELFHGRSATLIKFFLDRELRPLLQKMQNANISLEQMDDYLLARHAKEANAYIRKVNPDKSQNSGMTDKEADDFMKALPTSRRNALDSISRDIDAITKKTREIMVDTGLESQNTVNQWEKTYKNYVPLFREEIEDGRPISLGRGFDIRGSTTRQRMGSSRKVVDVLANIAMQRERTIVRGEKNRIGKSLYGLILDNPHKGFWGVINPEKMSKQAMRTELSNLGLDPNAVDDLVDRPPKKVINKSTGLVSYEVPQAWKSAPNIFATRINGEDRFMIFNKQDERAMRMVATLKSLDAQQQGEAIKMMGTAGDYYRKSIGGIGTVTRYFAQINTQYNPAFGIYNLMRDIGGAVLNLQTTPLKGQEAKVVSDALIALKAVYQDLRRQRQGLGANSKWASIFEEFESEGGKTGYRDLFETSESRAESLQQELKDFGQGKIRGSGKAVMGWLSDFNDAIENSVRVSVYHNAKQEGLSNAAAASLAKNITVNFNRSGAVSRNFQTLFAFFNASIQGTARIAQTLLTSEGKLSPTGKKIVMGGITLGIIQAALLAMAGLDEDEVPDFVKDKSFVIPYGDGKYFAIPMPLGYNVIPSFGRRVMEFAMSEEKNVGKAVFDTSSMIIDGFNPLGSATFVQTLTPTILDPIVALAENKDFTGKPIFRDDINSLSPTPGYTRGSQNSFAITEALAYGINILTGGSEFKKGALSPTPDQIEYLVGEAFGGVGREALKVGRGIESLATGEELATYNVPIVGRLTGNVQQQAAQRGKFFNNIRRLNEHQAEIEGRLLQGDDISDYIDQYPEASLYQAGDKIYNQITKLRRTKKVLEESGAGKDDLKSIDETILSLMSSLNEIYDSARQQ